MSLDRGTQHDQNGHQLYNLCDGSWARRVEVWRIGAVPLYNVRRAQFFEFQRMTNQPLVFISCGQYSSAEIELGKSVEALIREETAYEPYFAEQQNTLEGLSENILGSLARCSAFVGIMHHRGNVITPHGSLTRASVWVEQELAIAAFIQTEGDRPKG